MLILCNHRFTDETANALLADEVARRGHQLAWARSVTSSNLVASGPDPMMNDADVAFGQPDPASILSAPKLKFVQLTTAGYERYDRDDLRAALGARGVMLSCSSSVYQEPCAQHVLAMMLALARKLPDALDAQRTTHEWRAVELRAKSRLLLGQTVLILSHGSIARRLIELLAPFHMKVIAVRRSPTGQEMVPTVRESEVDIHLPAADHVVSILPGGAGTRHFMTARRFAAMKPGAIFYNIGRGTAVDQSALVEALRGGHLGAAYLDVFDPEPLAQDDPLWTLPNCHITPHTAGGHDDEFHRIVRHFMGNMDRLAGNQPLLDRVI